MNNYRAGLRFSTPQPVVICLLVIPEVLNLRIKFKFLGKVGMLRRDGNCQPKAGCFCHCMVFYYFLRTSISIVCINAMLSSLYKIKNKKKKKRPKIPRVTTVVTKSRYMKNKKSEIGTPISVYL